MCSTMIDIQSVTLRLGEEKNKKKKKETGQNIMSASATQGAIIKRRVH